MSLLSKLLGRRSWSVHTTLDRPLEIHGPTIGFLNLSGAAGARLLEADKCALGPLFSETRVSNGLPPPHCDVLFIYWKLNPEADAPGLAVFPRDVIRAAHAYIAVFALENDSKVYIEHIGKRSDWGANIVMVLDRNGDKFAGFFARLFAAMFENQSMLMAWIQLAPQGPSPKHAEMPSSILTAEAGHITFNRRTR